MNEPPTTIRLPTWTMAPTAPLPMFGVKLAGTALATTPPSARPALAAEAGVAAKLVTVAASAATTVTETRLVTKRETRMPISSNFARNLQKRADAL